MAMLKMEKPEKASWHYDKEADTLYLSFGKPVPALTLDLGSGVLARYIEDSGEIVGFTIVGLSEIISRG